MVWLPRAFLQLFFFGVPVILYCIGLYWIFSFDLRILEFVMGPITSSTVPIGLHSRGKSDNEFVGRLPSTTQDGTEEHPEHELF